MRKLADTLFKMLLIIFMLLSLCGCWNRRELNTLGIVLGVGIDISDRPNEIEMTTQVVKSSELKSATDESGVGKKAFINISDTGTDPFSIFRKLTHKVSRKLYIPHNQVIIFGEEMAKNGVYDSIDFFLRDHETRMTVDLLVAKGKASDIFESEPDFGKIPAAEIAQLIEAQKATSETAQLTIMEFLTCLTSKTCCAVVPIVELKEEDDKKIINISKGAVFKKDKVIGELDEEETRGYLWVINKVKSGVIGVQLKEENVDVEIIHANSGFKPVIKKDGSVLFKIKIEEIGMLGSKAGHEDLVTPENIKLLEKAEEDKIKQEVQSAIKKAREMDADIFGFGEKINSYKHKEWERIKGNWDKQFKNLEVQIDISVKIIGNGRISNIEKPEKE